MNRRSCPATQPSRPAGRTRPRPHTSQRAHHPGRLPSGSHGPGRARRLGAGLAAVVLASSLTACSALSEESGSGGSRGTDGTLAVSTSFYPIAYLAQAVGGDYATVTSVTPTSVEPHDYELAPKDVTALEQADVIAYVPGFQPSLDDAVAQVSGPRVLDLSEAADLVRHEGAEDEHDHADHDGDTDHEDGATATGTAGASTGATRADEDHGSDSHDDEADPHFWLDPQRMVSAAQAVEEVLSAADPDHAADYKASLKALTTALTELDTSYTDGLAKCERTTFVTSHAAFGYLADRYGLTQASVSGIDPEAEPSPAQLAEVRKVVEETGTTTVFTEELVSPKTAEALASETGATTAVLSPVESAPSEGDYVDAMTTNLEALRSGLSCQ